MTTSVFSSAHHTNKIKSEMNALIQHLREDVNAVDDTQLRALCETSAEVLGGLVKAFTDYELKNEAAWK
ncbi:MULTISPECIES: hypothetical protein [Ensifer]|jgi:hypothetical protein|uniref:Uncharacterized protein n=1 Tax=Ensifer canadensis TaxID=555315 RepID=A0AAW4FMZ9_9HYPH|nr:MULTISPECIES: hypothetical protein [Ensifer]KQW34866.1 hypothetical protein ASD02_16675 [Ensifer sp. Root1252]KQW55648.1 hypothetical protein ASD03_19025 [Ensifer sp. Root127]KQY76950.1 hypothetical protein ASD52_23405 [Ensifer sp. Root142]KRC57190.1 hypothetical protein ASE32_19990 [Ensifer sp. Root231]KRC87685.1 hypothetical protein ASE47_14145 [Ensifer sp. Root258]